MPLDPGSRESPAPGSGVAATSGHLEGRRIGPYQITARIGAGGMGEVYKALDTRLDRTVAIKVLGAQLAGNPQFRERFEREARAVAALNHPHICTLHDVGEATVDGDGSGAPIQFLVMEFLEGEALATRLTRGPLPGPQALQYGQQLASALDRAHRAGLIHRDLKPGNVMLTRTGAKLLDFGLAKFGQETVDHSDLTTTGMILGTLQYMAPEQLDGRAVDARTDIFAFGAVLYEMLTGKKLYAGSQQAAIARAIHEHDPDRLEPLSLPALDRAVRKCLARDPDERWQTAADLASELAWIARGETPAARRPASAYRRMRWAVAAGLAVAAIAAAAAAVTLVVAPPPPPSPTPKRFVVPLADAELGLGAIRIFSLLPDGSGLTYLAVSERQFALRLLTFADGVSRNLPGTERGRSPFPSPDGKWIGFIRDGRVLKVAISGGQPVAISDVPGATAAAWGPDDQIVVSAAGGLWRVSASGGRPAPLTALATGEVWHTAPEILPGGQAVVFTILSLSGSMEDATVAVVATGSGERRALIKGGAVARYVPTGHLVYVRGSDLLAVAFDPEQLTTTGTPFLVQSGVGVAAQFGSANFDLAGDGTLAYLPSGGFESQRTLTWVDRTGAVRPVPVPPRPYMYPSLLPDDRSIVVEIEDTPHNIWLCDLTTGALTRLTGESGNHRPVLSADGRFMTFSSDRTVPRSLFRLATDGSGTPEPLPAGAGPQNVTSWSRDGGWLAFTETSPETKDDIWVLPLAGDGKPRPFLKTTFSEQSAAFSPDGRWIAYSSDESGRREVLVSAFPGPGPRKQVSVEGGDTPVFSQDGGTLFYRLSGRVLAAAIVTEPELRIGAPEFAFAIPPTQAFAGLPNFSINRKGDALLAVKDPAVEAGGANIQVIVNWFDALSRAAGAK